MMVVPTDGNTTAPLLGWGPAVLWGVGVEGPPAFFVTDADPDEAAADADVAGAAALDPAGVAWAVLEAAPEAAFDEPGDPPHAASSMTSDPSPAAAAHPLLRITPLLHRDDSFRPSRTRAGILKQNSRAVALTGPGNAGAFSNSGADIARRELDHVPFAAVALRCQRLRALVGVQRVAVVRDLRGAVGIGDRAERARQGVRRAGQRLARDGEPDRSAGTGAGRLAALGVLAVGVDDLPVSLGEHIAEVGLLHDQHGRPRRRQAQRRAGRLAGRGGRGRSRTRTARRRRTRRSPACG